MIALHLTNENLIAKHISHSVVFYDLKNNKVLYNNHGGTWW